MTRFAVTSSMILVCLFSWPSGEDGERIVSAEERPAKGRERPLPPLTFPSPRKKEQRLRDEVGDTQEHFDKHIYPIAEGIENARKVVLYEALPRSSFGVKLLKKERKKKTVELHGELFYAQPITPKKADSKKLLALGANVKSFRRYGGMKLCGGFHADWCIEWQDGATVYRALICFGCNEAKLHGPRNKLHCDLGGSVEQLHKLLKPYRKNCPGPEESDGWKRLRRVDREKEIKIEIDKAVTKAGIGFSEWRWFGTKKTAIGVYVKATRAPLSPEALTFTTYDEEGRVLDRDRLGILGVSEQLEINESGLVIFSIVNKDLEKATRARIEMAPPRKSKGP